MDDPFVELEKVASRQAAAEKAMRTATAARSRLILTNTPQGAFFATLALELELAIDWDIETMATDGEKLFINPDWSASLTDAERVGVICHETLHVALRHHCRREGRNPEIFNIAADLAINQLILAAGFTLPRGRLMPGEGQYASFPLDKSTEEYYLMLRGASPPGGCGRADPGGCGQVLDTKDPAKASEQDGKWQAAVARAERASRTRGELPGGLARTAGQILHPPADWRDILREFVSAVSRDDSSWCKPNRRFISQGLYLPGRHGQRLGTVVAAIDRSGSVGNHDLAVMANELEAIATAYECEVVIIHHDSKVTQVDEWNPSDGPMPLEAPGGGGTSHRCVFEKIEELGVEPACIVCLTDCYTVYPSRPPDFPVLWAVVNNVNPKPPFGQVVQVAARLQI